MFVSLVDKGVYSFNQDSTNSIFLKNDINKINTSINNINEIKLSKKL